VMPSRADDRHALSVRGVPASSLLRGGTGGAAANR
jgi:hypothetical protein